MYKILRPGVHLVRSRFSHIYHSYTNNAPNYPRTFGIVFQFLIHIQKAYPDMVRTFHNLVWVWNFNDSTPESINLLIPMWTAWLITISL